MGMPVRASDSGRRSTVQNDYRGTTAAPPADGCYAAASGICYPGGGKSGCPRFSLAARLTMSTRPSLFVEYVAVL